VRSYTGWLAVVLVAACAAEGRGADADWAAAAKRLVTVTTDHLAKRVKGDAQASDAVKRMAEWLMKEKQVDMLADELQKKTGTEKPSAEKIKAHHTAILKKIDALDLDKLKAQLKEIKDDGNAASISCPPRFWNCDD